MNTNWTDIIARNPRFRVIGDLKAHIFPDSSESTTPIVGKVVNISRMGARFHIPKTVKPGSSLTVEMILPNCDLQIRVPATVCWARPLDDGQIDIGCRLEREIGWETMGELFLNDVIATFE